MKNRGLVLLFCFCATVTLFAQDFSFKYGKVSDDELKNIASEYSTMLDTFRLDYQAYEEQLATTMDIDCSSKPVKFYDSVLSARTKRSLVHADVIKLNAQLAKYQEALDVFSSSFNTNNSEAKQ